jgi:hypothetical protein
MAARPDRRSGRLRAAAALALAAALAGSADAPAEAPLVDLELVIAVDVSGSIDEEEARMQREGYVAAFRHPQVVRAIQAGYKGRVAITYVEWAGEHYQRTLVDWTLVHDQASADAFAEAVAARPLTTAAWTSVTGAIEYGRKRLQESAFRGKRRVIDISGDGPNNSGGFVVAARDKAVAEGIVINGLPIVNEKPSRWGMPPFRDLDRYYEDCVIGGQGAFMIVARSFNDFARAIVQKLILEIAGVAPADAAPRLAAAGVGRWARGGDNPGRRRAQAEGRYDCAIGERQMRMFRDR